MNLQQGGRRFVEFWISSWALLSVGESIGICFCALTTNGGLAVSLVSAGLTLLGQVNGIVSATVPHWLQIIAWVRQDSAVPLVLVLILVLAKS